MFTGLSAFPLTPLAHDAVDEASFIRLVERLAAAKVDSITALGSTGSYAYFSSEERSRVAHLAVQYADGTPVIVGTERCGPPRSSRTRKTPSGPEHRRCCWRP